MMGLFDSQLDKDRVEIARLKEQLRVTQKLCDSMRQEKIDLEGRLVKATAQLNKLLGLAGNDDTQRHKELMGALGRIEDALRLRPVEVGSSIKIDAPKVTMRQRMKRGVFADEPKAHAGGGFPGDHNGTKTFFKGERVVIDDSTHLAGVVEWCNNGICRVQFDPIGKIEMPRGVFPCAALKRETARPFQIGDRVRIQGYELINGNIVELMNDGEVRILLDGERVILSVIVHEKDVVLIERAQS